MVRVGDFKPTQKMEDLVVKAIRSGRLSSGPYVKELEDTFSKQHQCKHGIFLNSGTSALHIAIQAMKLQHEWNDGDEILVPAVTFVATYNAVLHNNLKPVLVDVDLDDYGMSPELATEAVTPRTVAMIPVHLFGQPCKIDKLEKVSWDTKLLMIEDSCETMYAECNGKRVGSWGDLSCFSTYMAHLLTTGVGGFILTKWTQDHTYDLCKSLVNHGRDTSYITIDDRADISKRFLFNHIGHSFRATELQAAIGVAQLDDIEEQIEIRRCNARKLTQALSKYPLILPKVKKNCTHSFMMYPILFDQRDDLVQHLEDNEVETRPLVSITNQPCYDLIENLYPNAWICNRNGFYIGCHHCLDTKNLYQIIDAFDSYFKVK